MTPRGFDFGTRLRCARKRRDMTAEQLSRRSAIPASQLSHYECNRRQPSYHNIRSIALALDITADFLLGLTEDTRRVKP